MTYETTLAAIRAHHPCLSGWKKLLAHLGKSGADDEPLPILTILESNGLDDALWALRVLPEEHDGAVRLLACDFAERALRYVPEGDGRPRQAIDIARRYARGAATSEEMEAAGAAAGAAARSAAARSAVTNAAAARVAARAASAVAAQSAERAEQERMLRVWLGA